MHDIVINNLSKSYKTKGKDIFVVQDISLTVKRGTVFGLIGPNGAGKTSTIKMLVGLSHPTSGTLEVLGSTPDDLGTRSHIGFMPESPQFYQHLTGYEFLEFVATLFGLHEIPTRIKGVLTKVNLIHAEHKPIRTYSKGMLQRLGLAQAIINNPKILFLDEPLDGLDALGRAEVKKIILALKREGKTIFINTHILSDVAEICDEVGVFDLGRLVATGSPKEITGTHSDLETAFVSLIEKKRSEEALTH